MPDTEPSASSSTAESYGNFDLVKRVELDFTPVTIHKWRSRESGLTIVHLDYEAPIVEGYFTVATEIFDDTGCPHTLEHLVFTGSERYPYKGTSARLASRCFSDQNAWTSTDHTAYTVSTAGSQGFLQNLPIYIDHILYPTLTDASFITEVHHVDPQCEDQGVVYSEMQGRENTPADLVTLKVRQLINPVGSAYRSDTNGLMGALRELTVEQIRKYHDTYYVPHNLVLIVMGKLTGGTEQLLSVVQNEVEPTIAAHHQNKGVRPPGWKRPFVETFAANRQTIGKYLEETVEFPEQDESSGQLLIGFTGPLTGDWLEAQALDCLERYLTSSATAPLNKEYIEIVPPLWTRIYFEYQIFATRGDRMLHVDSVPTEHLATFDSKLQESFKRIASEGIDLERMCRLIDREERQNRLNLEKDRGDLYSFAMILDFLYDAPDGSDIEPFLNEIRLNKELRKWTSQQWVTLLIKYFITPERAVVIGKPSAAMLERREREEKERIAQRREALGEKSISEAVERLNAAKAQHERPVPTEILTSFPVPDVASIAWIPVQSVQLPGTGRQACELLSTSPADALLATHLLDGGQDLPFFVQYDHVQSDFVSVTALLSLANLPDDLRPHIAVYLAAFFDLPVVRHTGERLGHEQVVHALEHETVTYGADCGVNGIVPETLRVCICVEKERYATAVAWLRDLIYGAEFDRERLAINVAQIQSVLPSCKRDGNTVLASVVAGLLFNSSSTNSAVSIMPQSDFIPRLAARLKEEPDTVINEFEQMRKTITEPSGVRFSVAGNILDLSCPRSVWAEHFSEALPATPLAPLPFSDQTLSEIGRKPVKRAVVVSLATIESAFVSYTGAGIRGWQHEDWPALRVAIEVLGATESFLWRYIRGSGLAYGAYAGVDLEAGHVSFSLYRASNALAAAAQGKVVVNGLADASIALKETDLDAAKSSIVFGVTNSVAGPVCAAMAAFTNMAIRGVPARHSVEMLEKYRTVTCEDVRKVIKTYFVRLFDPESSVVVSVNSSGKADEIAEGLMKEGYIVERRKLDVDPEESEGSEDESGSESGDSGSDSVVMED